MGPSGGQPSKWVHFERVHRIIGTNAANSNPILESFSYVSNTPTVSKEIFNRYALNYLLFPKDGSSNVIVSEAPSSQESFPIIEEIELLDSPISMSQISPTPSLSSLTSAMEASAGCTRSAKRKREHNNNEILNLMKQQTEQLQKLQQTMVSSFDKALEQQKESDKAFMELFKKTFEK